MKKILLSLACLALVATACNKTPNVTLTVGHVPSSVEGNVVSIPASVSGIKIVKADGDTSGKSGHYHVFIDRAPVHPPTAIPKERGIVHSADSPIKVYGLTPGKHRFHVVLGNGSHQRINGEARATFSVDVKGPGVQGTAPATLAKGQDLVVNLKAEGVTIVEPGTESSDNEGHFHVMVDLPSAPKAGTMLDTAELGGTPHSFMTGASSQTIKGLTAGEHVIWVVLADKDHKAWKVPVMDKITVTVA